MRQWQCLILCLFLFCGQEAHAVSVCSTFRNVSPQPWWYPEVCGPGGGGGGLGGAYSSISGAMNLNPAAIPTLPFPLGLESISSFGSGLSKQHFALVKGFRSFGTALSTNSDETFYGLNTSAPAEAYLENSANSPYTTATTGTLSSATFNQTLSWGVALSLSDWISAKGWSLSTGVTTRLNRQTGEIRLGYGVTFHLGRLRVGASHAADPKSAEAPERTYTSLIAGLDLYPVQIELTRLQTIDEPSTAQYDYAGYSYTVSTARRSRYNDILSVALQAGPVTLIGAYRNFEDLAYQKVSLFHFGAQIPVNSKIAVGVLHNYIPGLNSISLQMLF